MLKEHTTSRSKAEKIAERDGGWKCHYCGVELNQDPSSYQFLRGEQDKDFTNLDGPYGRLAVVEHVVPKIKGGTGKLDNLVLACRKCNSHKGVNDRDSFITWVDFADTSDSNIRIRRASHGLENPYFLVRRDTAQDDSLSWEALGLLVYVLSKPDDWSVRPADLRQRCGRDKVYKILNELIQHRYVKRVESVDEKGRHLSTDYEIYESPLPEKPDTDLPDTENTDYTYKREEQSTDSTEKKTLSQIANAPAMVEPEKLVQNAETSEQPHLLQEKSVTHESAESVQSSAKVSPPLFALPPKVDPIDKPLKDAVAQHIQGIKPDEAVALTGILAQKAAGVWRRRLHVDRLTSEQYQAVARSLPVFVQWYRSSDGCGPECSLPSGNPNKFEQWYAKFPADWKPGGVSVASNGEPMWVQDPEGPGMITPAQRRAKLARMEAERVGS